MRNLIVLITETLCKFCNKLFDTVKMQLLQSERDFGIKPKRNFGNYDKEHNANFRFLRLHPEKKKFCN